MGEFVTREHVCHNKSGMCYTAPHCHLCVNTLSMCASQGETPPHTYTTTPAPCPNPPPPRASAGRTISKTTLSAGTSSSRATAGQGAGGYLLLTTCWLCGTQVSCICGVLGFPGGGGVYGLAGQVVSLFNYRLALLEYTIGSPLGLRAGCAVLHAAQVAGGPSQLTTCWLCGTQMRVTLESGCGLCLEGERRAWGCEWSGGWHASAFDHMLAL
jgi:hypothetical protein